MRHFEDFRVGDRWELGKRTLSREEIVAFAQEWDPQAFHTGERESVFGDSVIASGVQTMGVWMRMFVDTLLRETAVVAGKSATLRMFLPVEPDLELVGTAEVVALEASESRPQGVITFRGQLHDGKGRLLWEQEGGTVVACNPVVPTASAPDPQRFTFAAPSLSEAEEDALWDIAEDGPLVIIAVADQTVSVEYTGDGDAETVIALLSDAVPGLALTLHA